MNRNRFWRYVRGLAAPVLLWALFAGVLVEPIQTWLKGDEAYDRAALREWIEESRVFRSTLPELARDYFSDLERWDENDTRKVIDLVIKREQIEEHLKSLGTPPKLLSAQLPLFPIIYRLSLAFPVESRPHLPATIVWDSDLPRQPNQYQELTYPINDRAHLTVQYQLHAFNKRQQSEQANARRFRWVTLLAVSGTALSLLWIYLVQHRERERERQRARAEQQVAEAERRREETERKLLEQRLATQAAEGKALELKSQLYASIGIMAGSYAHNIKNLLVRPNDLLRRCMEADGLPADRKQMLEEVRETLGTVTERLQQILRTVRRDPSRSEPTRLDLNEVVRELHRTWQDLGREKWKLGLSTELAPEPLWIDADLSHLQQAIENLIFNARDATFEMRNHLREQAHRRADLSATGRKEALIAAAGWRGSIVMRTRRDGDGAVLEVQDNGIGMTDEVRIRCRETHFSTKRDNAVYEGNSTGMGLGLSFVAVILEHHRATLDIESEPLRGALFRVRFPLAATAAATNGP